MSYYLGLDIGTNSVGWAVTDPDYRVIKKKGKALWGIRLFDEAQTAADRRSHRTARRRLERRKQRITWLREVFSEEIAKADPAFFIRMDESKFLETDKKAFDDNSLGKYTLFNDSDFTDKEYHKKYPTIFHLRKALISENCKFDIRLLYLAVHHIMKNRGHFLFGDINIDDVTFESCLNELSEYLENKFDTEFFINDSEYFKQVLMDHKLSLSIRESRLSEISGYGKKDKFQYSIIKLLAGGKVKPSAFLDREIDEEADKNSFNLDKDIEEFKTEHAEFTEEEFELLILVKKIYDWSLLAELRAGNSFLSYAKVKIYEQHKEDLALLKKLFKRDKNAYKKMFKNEDEKNNYASYSNHCTSNRSNYLDFKKYTLSIINNFKNLDEAETETAEKIKAGFDSNTFLPLQVCKNNGIIPYQLHLQELEEILDKACKHYLFLNTIDDSGLSLKERIISMFTFRIPYYVGPLNNKSSLSWVSRTNEKITPWNFEKVVDLSKSAENFITKMTSVCSYIGKPVLPKDSLLYSKFVTLNLINKICINGYPINPETKQEIFNFLVKKGKGSFKTVKDYLVANGIMGKNDNISGIDTEVKFSLNSYKIFEDLIKNGKSIELIEDIIKHIVLFEDRKLLSGWLKNTYGNTLTDEECKYILNKRTQLSGWGNLSKEFLTDIKHGDKSIIDMLWECNKNLMELLSEQYDFSKAISKYKADTIGNNPVTLNQFLKDSYVSPGIKRSIYQTVSIISELEKIMGEIPTKIFLEVTRSDDEKKRTVSRKNQITILYKKYGNEYKALSNQLENYSEAELRSKKLYLYFMQLGKCMYSGEAISLDNLAAYDIDHIIPQSKKKDDSPLNNMVLVKKELNAEKGDKYPLPSAWRNKMHQFWYMLKDRNFITKEKFDRLVRGTGFTDDELAGFISRQIVETSQSCKIVADLLKNRYKGENNIVYVKAQNVASFKQDQRILPDGTQIMAGFCKNIETKQDPVFIKCREVNDFHHAKDAYLNIVVGNVYDTRFTRSPMNFIKNKDNKDYSLNTVFKYDVKRDGSTAWIGGENGTITTVRKQMMKNNILFTRYAHEVSGGLFDQQLMKKGNGQAMIKASDPRLKIEDYGGYNKIASSFFFMVEHKDKKKTIRSIETVYIMYKSLYEKDPVKYCEEILGLVKPVILIKKIKINSLFSYDGFKMHLSGNNDKKSLLFKNSNHLILSPEENEYVKLVKKYSEGYISDIITEERNTEVYELLINKLKSPPFNIKRNDIAETLIEFKNLPENDDKYGFNNLSILNQCKILLEIIKFFSVAPVKKDFKLLCGKGDIGRLVPSRKLEIKSNIKLINQSVTGFYEKEIDLSGTKF